MRLYEFCACVHCQVDALRLRLEEKETTLNKKSKQIQEMSEEKGTLNGEIHDLKDMLDVKERKVNVLQKKVKVVAQQFSAGLYIKTVPKLFIILKIRWFHAFGSK